MVRCGPWHCYILRGAGRVGRNYTYVGKTNNMTRRLRQHNGELHGGARRTHTRRPHRPFIIIGGFPSERAALQFEWAMKHRRAKNSRGQAGRIRTLEHLLLLSRWTTRSPWQATLQLVVRTTLTRHQYVSMMPDDPVLKALVRDTCNVSYEFGMDPLALISVCTPH